MKIANLILLGALLAACSTPSIIPGVPLPSSLHADLIFVGRITASEPIFVADGDVFMDAKSLTFESVDQPGTGITAIDTGWCQSGDLGKKALLVLLRRNSPLVDASPDRPFFVYACPVIDAEVVRELREHEVCFRPDPPDYFCQKR